MPNWHDLEHLLAHHVPLGEVTTYGDVSAHFYNGVRNRGQPVSAMLGAIARQVQPDLSHRVVRDDGSMAPGRPGGPGHQQAMLTAEGVTFDQYGHVDLAVHRSVLP